MQKSLSNFHTQIVGTLQGQSLCSIVHLLKMRDVKFLGNYTEMMLSVSQNVE